MIEPRLLKGFRDYGPEEQAARQNMFSKIQTVFERFGFLPLSTPVLEYEEILRGKIGEDEKLIYSFKDNGDRDVAMRYDLTVPLARYIAQNQNEITYPFKRYQIAPVWRADNPQKGRLREFYQCDIDVVGTDSPLADAEVIACLCKSLEEVGITNYRVLINDRRLFQIFDDSKEIIRAIDKLSKIGEAGVLKELEGKKVSQENLIQVTKFLGMAGMESSVREDGFEEIYKNSNSEIYQSWKALLVLRDLIKRILVNGGEIIIDPTIARGLDYYSSTVFEIVLADKLDFGSIVAGGRYDGLVDKFSKTSTPAVGGSIGIDRLFDEMQELGLVKNSGLIKALVINQAEDLQDDYISLVDTLRSAGINSEVYYQTAKLDKQFKYAESKGIAFAVIMGADEKAKSVAQVKDLKTREQTEVSLTDLASFLGNV